MTSPADELRAAATKLRATARKATPGPWQMDGPMWWSEQDCTHTITDQRFRASVAILPRVDEAGDRRDADAEWIALASPALAEPLAAWLEECAEGLETAARVATRWPDGEGISDPIRFYDEPSSAARAYAIARVLNGGQQS